MNLKNNQEIVENDKKSFKEKINSKLIPKNKKLKNLYINIKLNILDN